MHPRPSPYRAIRGAYNTECGRDTAPRLPPTEGTSSGIVFGKKIQDIETFSPYISLGREEHDHTRLLAEGVRKSLKLAPTAVARR